MLKEGDIVYGGALGQSGFYFDKATLEAANGSRQKLWESLQVLPHEKYGFRSKIQMYRVKRDAIAGTGQALSSDTEMLGSGGGTHSSFRIIKKFWNLLVFNLILGCENEF